MRVVLSVIGKFHTFDLARELANRGALTKIFTGYPRFKLKNERLSDDLISTFPWINAPYMALRGRNQLGKWSMRQWERVNCLSFDHATAMRLPPCDVFVGLSSAALVSGRQAKAKGAKFVCDRGSSHIRFQRDILKEEFSRWGLPFDGPDPRFIEREELEYASADCITVPSAFSVKSFVASGVDPKKVHVLRYGVDLGEFFSTTTPASDRFDVLFAGGAGIRKGVPDLLTAFRDLKHPKKRLYFAGSFPEEFRQQMVSFGLWSDDIELLGHLNWQALRDRMSKSHVLALPSIEEGFGLVIPQAMACGCPIVASENTGAPDLFADGEAGYIIPIRSPKLLCDRLQHLADAPAVRERMRAKAVSLVKNIGGWRSYGDEALRIYQGLMS